MIDVRRASLGDLDALAALFDAYRQFYHQPADLGLARRFLAERLTRDESVLFLAEAPDAALGFVQLYPVFSSTATPPGRLWLLNDLFVTPAGRRRGVARALMNQATTMARDTGATGLFLSTARDNLPAQALYQSLGYRRDEVFLVYELPLAL